MLITLDIIAYFGLACVLVFLCFRTRSIGLMILCTLFIENCVLKYRKYSMLNLRRTLPYRFLGNYDSFVI